MAVPERGRHAVTGKYPFYDVYETADGKYLTVGCLEPWFYSNLCRALGRDDLIGFQSAAPEKQEEIRTIFREIFRQKTRDEWERELGKHDLCAGSVLGPDEVIKQQHFQERGIFIDAEHPELWNVRQVGVAIKLSDTPGTAAGFSPRRGEHTDEVLAGLGYLKEDIALLRQAGCVK